MDGSSDDGDAGLRLGKPVPVDPRYFKKPKQGMALTALPFGIYAEETAWEEETNASEETLDGGLDESAEEFADGLPDYIPEPETDVVDGAADDESDGQPHNH